MLLNLCASCTTLAELLLFFVVSIFLFKLLYFCLHEFYIHVIGSLTLKSRLKNYGEWAVITGCTRGLGVEYCQQLAALGINLILLARNEALVKKQAQNLEKSYGIKTCCIIVDFDSVDEKSMTNVFDELKDKDVGILVNNAGVMYEFPDVLHNIDDQVLKRISNVNVTWPIRLCHYLVKEKMLDKKKGLIVFMSSAAGKRRTPLLTAYGASKAFIYYLSKCLSTEYMNTGVHFQVVTPFYIANDMTKYSKILNKPGFLTPNSSDFVRNALQTFGMTSETTGYFPHALQGLLLSLLLPDFVHDLVAKYWQLHLKDQRQS